MEMATNALTWFEIPVEDFDRAKAFYSAVYQYEMPEMPFGESRMGFLPHEQGKGIGGAIISGVHFKPSADGPKVYLSAGQDLTPYLERVEAAGGKVTLPKTLINEDLGYFAGFVDTEGNAMFFHSLK